MERKSKVFKSEIMERKSKVFADSVHQTISLSGLLLDIIDTPEMQRLRRLMQLGPVNLVYPSATHDRFSHSLGVCHLAGRMIDVLEYKDEKEKEKDKLCVQIAGLCHDLGHGPWSHVYDKAFLKGLLGIKWKHEEMSCELLERIRDRIRDREGVKNFENYGITDDVFENIKDMIKGKQKEELKPEQKRKAYLYQIVANKDYGIDVDKWDYFKRDAQACGMTETFDFERAFQTVKICDTEGGSYRELCYRKGDALNMFYLFNKRFFLFKKIYHHKVVYGTEIMLAEAMKEVSSIKEARNDVNEYMKLDDVSCMAKLKDNDKAREIIEKLENRQLYQCVFEEQCDKESLQDTQKKMEKLLEDSKFNELKKYIRIKIVYFNLDPLKTMPFYEKNEDVGKPLPDLNEISVMLPKKFDESFIRIYRTEDNPDQKKKVDQFLEECERLVKQGRN